MKQPYSLDDTDIKIVEILRKDARLSVRKIAKLTGLKPSTVHVRIKKLLKENVIEYNLKVSSEALNENYVAFAFLSTDSGLEKGFLSNDHIKEAFSITGEYDLMLKMRFKDAAEFNDFIVKLKKQAGIKKILTNVAMNAIKE